MTTCYRQIMPMACFVQAFLVRSTETHKIHPRSQKSRSLFIVQPTVQISEPQSKQQHKLLCQYCHLQDLPSSHQTISDAIYNSLNKGSSMGQRLNHRTVSDRSRGPGDKAI